MATERFVPAEVWVEVPDDADYQAAYTWTPVDEPVVVKHCGLLLPGDTLACPCCGRWIHETFTD